jgi:two-component system, NarL family, response regulator
MRSATGIRVLIIDDHPVVRQGLMVSIGRRPEMTVVGAVADAGQGLDHCRTDRPDVILLDLRLPGTPPEDAVTQVHRAHPAGRILLLSTDEAGEDLCRALDAGAAGCLLRTAELEEMVEAIRAVHAGAPWLSAAIEESCRAYRAAVNLCDDELACLRLLAAGKTLPQIAAVQRRSERHVRDQMRRIQKTLGATNRTHALVTALQRGIVSLDELQTVGQPCRASHR